MADPEANKRNVVASCEMMFNACEPRQAIETYVGAEYIQHNPHVASGKDGFIECFERMAAEYPGKRVEIKRTLADGNNSFCIATRFGQRGWIIPR